MTSYEERPRFSLQELLDEFQPGSMISHFTLNDDNTYSVVSHIVCEYCDYCGGSDEVGGLEIDWPERLQDFKGLLGPFYSKPDIYERDKIACEAYDLAQKLKDENPELLFALQSILKQWKMVGPWVPKKEKYVRYDSVGQQVAYINPGGKAFNGIPYDPFWVIERHECGVIYTEEKGRASNVEEAKRAADECLKRLDFIVLQDTNKE